MNTTVPSAVAKVITALFLVFVGYAGVQFWRAALDAEQFDPSAWQQPAPDHSAEERAEAAKPRFIGDIGGIFIAPSVDLIPEGYGTNNFKEACAGATTTHDAPWSRAGVYGLDLKLPKNYRLDSKFVVECGTTVTSANWEYTGPIQPTGDAPYVSIGRSSIRYSDGSGFTFAEDRPKIITTGGRQVVIIEPISDDGFGQVGKALIAEPFGMTDIHTIGLPRAEFRKLVEIVASSTSKQ